MRKALRLSAAIAAVCVFTALPQAQIQTTKATNYKEKVLHAFTGGSDGRQAGPLMRDAKGNLYGVAAFGGNTSGECGQQFGSEGCGVVFEQNATGKFRVLHRFDFTHGAVPSTNLIQDASGNLYGTTPWGGNSTCELHGCGVLFKLTPSGKFSVLYSFTGGSDGGNPGSGLIRDAKGNLYGTTALTASSSGEVFELTTSGQLEVLYSFTGGTDGEGPNGVIQDSKGNLYGSTFGGGAFGNGTVFKLDTSGTETVLYSFKGKSDGGEPTSRLIMDSAGNLYGTTQLFGDHKGNCDLPNSPPGCGTAFKVDTAGVFSVLVKFDYADGDNPYNSPLTPDTHGNFSGTTLKGGDGCGGVGCGVAYKLSAAGKESVFYNFKGGSDGDGPSAGVVEDSKGNLYGTTSVGGDASCDCGVIFELTKL